MGKLHGLEADLAHSGWLTYALEHGGLALLNNKHPYRDLSSCETPVPSKASWYFKQFHEWALPSSLTLFAITVSLK